MKEDCEYFKNMSIDKHYLQSILDLHPSTIPDVDSGELSSYTVQLAQYNIWRQYRVNELKVNLMRLERNMELALNLVLTKEVIKEYKSIKAAVSYLIASTSEFKKMDDEIFELKCVLELERDLDKGISELIASFKRELTRRENELYAIRKGA